MGQISVQSIGKLNEIQPNSLSTEKNVRAAPGSFLKHEDPVAGRTEGDMAKLRCGPAEYAAGRS